MPKPSAFATGEGPRSGLPTGPPPSDSNTIARGWSFPQAASDLPPTPTSFVPTQATMPSPLNSQMPITTPPHFHHQLTPTAMSSAAPSLHASGQKKAGRQHPERQQSSPAVGEAWTSLVKRQEAARLRKISNGISRSASAGTASAMAIPNLDSTSFTSGANGKGTAKAYHLRGSSGTSSMHGSPASAAQMSSMMQTSIMQNNLMLTQMMTQRMVTNNSGLRRAATMLAPNQHKLHVGTSSPSPQSAQVQHVPSQSMQMPTAQSPALQGSPGRQQVPFNTMMPPRPATNMPMSGMRAVKSGLQSPPQMPHSPLMQLPQQPPARANSEPSATVTAELVATLGAKMKEICEHQSILLEQIAQMQQKIQDKDEVIAKLQTHERDGGAEHKQERIEMADELQRLKQQVHSMQSVMDVTVQATTPEVCSDVVLRPLSTVNIDSDDMEGDSQTTNDQDPDEPSTASTSDGKEDKAASTPSTSAPNSEKSTFRPDSFKKKRDLDALFQPKAAQRSGH